MNDEDIKTKKAEHPHKGLIHTHPSFGMISVSRCQGGSDRLFGSELESNSFMRVTISECEVTQDLGRNWYHARNEIVEAYMSPVQYAEMISSPNTSGVPCTINHRQDLGRIVPRNIDTVTQFAMSELEGSAEAIKEQAKHLTGHIEEILNRKGATKRADKDEVISLVRKLCQDVSSNFKFHEKCVKESIAASVVEAKAEIDTHISHAITSIGVDALRSPEALKLILNKDD